MTDTCDTRPDRVVFEKCKPGFVYYNYLDKEIVYNGFTGWFFVQGTPYRSLWDARAEVDRILAEPEFDRPDPAHRSPTPFSVT